MRHKVAGVCLIVMCCALSAAGIEQVPEDKCKHVSSEKYTAQQDDEVSFEKNAVIVVKEKRLDGWWKVEYQGIKIRYLGLVRIILCVAWLFGGARVALFPCRC